VAALTGKTALVTGASRGIGRAIAERLAADGAHVAVHYGSNDAAASDAVACIEASGGVAFAVRATLGVPGDVDTLFAGVERGLAGRPLNVLVSNAAVISNQDSIEQATPADFDRLFAVNVRAPLFIIQRALPRMAPGGRIVIVSSGVTKIASPEVIYTMTKGALNVLCRSLAHMLGPRGINVNVVSPGITDTDMAGLSSDPEAAAMVARMTALGRNGAPDDIADAVSFFAGNDSRWVTGEVLEVNGGLCLGPSFDSLDTIHELSRYQ
jgi:NAD(P)-dependent dehydrogenase (short-subunit alcohol dehydrogenase family)